MDTNSKTQKQKVSDKRAVQQKSDHTHTPKKLTFKFLGKLKKKIFPLSHDLKIGVTVTIVTIILTALTQQLIEGYLNYRNNPKIIGTPESVNYALKAEWPFIMDDKIKYKKGVRYFVRAYLKSLNKTYHVSDVRVSIYLKPGHFKEGILKRGSPPPPNADTLDIQYLRTLEKDKDYLCDIYFFVEGGHKSSIAEMAFEKIELRLYDHNGRYEKVELFQSDFPE